MTRLQVALALALVASSLVVVRTYYESRRLYTELDRARHQQRQLDVEFRHLEAERQAQATHLRVEKAARERLSMRPATPAVTHYVAAPATVAQPEVR